MSKFKFGDVVRHKGTQEIFVVSDFGEDDGFLAAMSKQTATVWDVKADELELIPHPDTERLDCIGALVAGSFGQPYDPGQYRAEIDATIKNQKKGNQND